MKVLGVKRSLFSHAVLVLPIALPLVALRWGYASCVLLLAWCLWNRRYFRLAAPEMGHSVLPYLARLLLAVVISGFLAVTYLKFIVRPLWDNTANPYPSRAMGFPDYYLMCVLHVESYVGLLFPLMAGAISARLVAGTMKEWRFLLLPAFFVGFAVFWLVVQRGMPS